MESNTKYCRICGAPLELKQDGNEGLVPYCPACGQFRYPQYNVAVSMIVVNEASGEILLIQQYGHPFYILVAGYVARGESLEDAAVRELKEETGMTAGRLKFNRTRYFEPSDSLMCNFTVFVKNAEEMNPNYEIDSFRWFSPEEARNHIKPGSLAEYFLDSYLDEAKVH